MFAKRTPGRPHTLAVMASTSTRRPSVACTRSRIRSLVVRDEAIEDQRERQEEGAGCRRHEGEPDEKLAHGRNGTWRRRVSQF